jgi:hypothetical protein
MDDVEYELKECLEVARLQLKRFQEISSKLAAEFVQPAIDRINNIGQSLPNWTKE